jgi:hypothetical protein
MALSGTRTDVILSAAHRTVYHPVENIFSICSIQELKRHPEVLILLLKVNLR